MRDSANTVTVKILDKEYQVACPPEEVDALTRSAQFLHNTMAEIRRSGKVVGLDRIAVMAALNIANDMLKGKSTLDETESAVGKRIELLSERVGQALAKHKQPDL